MEQNIILIGFMGSGKSTIGRLLAECTNRDFYDTDAVIEEYIGKSISDIFLSEGESYFRAIERQVIKNITSGSNKVIATGGGAVLDPENLVMMNANGVLIGLLATEETIWQRLIHTDGRPLISGENAREKLHKLYNDRKPIYQSAPFTIDVDGKTPEVIVEEILVLVSG